MRDVSAFLTRFPRAVPDPGAGNSMPDAAGSAHAPTAPERVAPSGPSAVDPQGSGLAGLLSRPRPGREPEPGPTPAPGAGGSSGVSLDLFGEDVGVDGARAAPPASSGPAPSLDLFPEEPAEVPSTPASEQAAGPATAPATGASAARPGTTPSGTGQRPAAPTWTSHFPQAHGRWTRDDLGRDPKVLVLNPVQSATGFLTISQPPDLGAPGRLQAVAQLREEPAAPGRPGSPGRLLGAPQGVRNIDPLVDYSATELRLHLHHLRALERCLVVFTPRPGLPAGASAVIRLVDDFSESTWEAHLTDLDQVKHVAVFSAIVISTRLVLRLENRRFTGSVGDVFASFGYRLGAPHALGLMEHP